MKLRNILVFLMGITLLISACSNNATVSKADLLERKSEYGELPNKLNEAQTIIEVTTDKKEYSTQSNELILKIKNTGTTTVGFGLPLYIEKLIDGAWYQIPYRDDYAFADVTSAIEPYSNYEQEVHLEYLDYQLTVGNYRVVKAFNVTEGEYVLGAEFEMKE